MRLTHPSPPQRLALGTAFAVLLAASAAACSQMSSGGGTLDPRGGSGGDGNEGSGSGGTIGAPATSSGASAGGSGGTGSSSGTTGSSGGTGASDGGAPPPSQPAVPGGFQLTIAPLLDAQGCTECHHHGRPIDVTTYPFMAGTPASAAQQLVTSFTTNMPPAPRTTVPQTVIDQVNAWVDAGMLP